MNLDDLSEGWRRLGRKLEEKLDGPYYGSFLWRETERDDDPQRVLDFYIFEFSYSEVNCFCVTCIAFVYYVLISSWNLMVSESK